MNAAPTWHEPATHLGGRLPLLRPDQLSPEQRQLYDRALDPALYEEARQALDPKALVDLVVLAGIYGLVCGLLNGFAIPAPMDPP